MPYLGNNHIAGDHVNNFKVLDDISSFTATFDGSATSVVDTTNNTIRVVEHRFIQGQRVTYTNGSGGDIGGLTNNTAYFVIFDSASTIKLATSASNAANSTAINLSALGTGSSHTLNVAFDGVNTKFKLTHGSGIGARLNNATQINVAINNVVQRPNLDPNNFTDGFALEDNHKIVFQTAPTSQDIFWGSIIANTLTTFDISDHKIDTFTGDGSTTEFTLSHTPANNESLMVTINGVLQHPSNASTARAYTLIASIIQFTAAPGVGDEIQVRHLGFAGATTADVSGFYGRTGNVALTTNDHITIGDIPTVRNINASGIITASQFVGNLSSNVGGSNANFTGIVTAGVFKGGDFDGRNLNISGIATFAGDVSIGGTLTYEDVTNIDSVGIVTARDGVFLPDDKQLKLGNTASAPDFKLYHSSGINYIDASSGDFALRGTGNDNILYYTSNGDVEIYDNANKKFETTSSGVIITGILTTTDLDVVRILTTTDLDVDGHTNLDNVSVAGVSTFSGLVNANANVTITNTNPKVSFTDSDANSDYSIHVNAGNFQIKDETNGVNQLRIHSDGTCKITGNLDAESGVDVTGNITGTGDLTLTDTTADANAGPEFKLFRNSASPANADYLGQIKFAGESDTGVERNYAKITGKILDASNGTEDGIIEFAHIKGGSQTITGRWRSDSLQLLNDTNLSVAGDTTLTGDLDVDGHTNLDNVSVSGATTCTGGAVFMNSISLNASTNNYLYFNDNLNFTRNGHGNEMTIDSNGNISLAGQTNNSDIHSTYQCLQVHKSAYIWGYSSASYPAVHITNNARPTTSSFITGWKRDVAGTYTAPVQLELYTGNFNVRTADDSTADSDISWSTKFTVTQAGKIGINKSSPDVALHMANDTASPYIRNENTGSNSSYTGFSLKTPTLDCQIWNQGPNGSGYGGANSMNFYQSGTYGAFAFYHGNDERLRITTDKVMFSVDAKVDGNNQRDLGTSGNRWKSLFLGTQLNIAGQGSSNATPRLLIEDGTGGDNDFSISQYEDANGTYTLIGQNVQLDGNGNENIRDSNHKTASIYLDARNSGAVIFNTGGTNTHTERLRIASDGKVHVNYNAGSNPGNDKLNIMGGGDGITIARGTSNANDGNILGNINFHSYMSGSYHANAEAKIEALADTGQSGSSAPTHLDFYTKSSSAGPGSSPSHRLRISSGGQVGMGQDGNGTINTRAVLELNAPFNDVSDNDGSAAYTMNNHDALLINFSGASYSSGTNVGSISWTNGGRRRAAIMAEYQHTDGDYLALSFWTRGTDGAGDFYRSFIINRNGSAGLHGALSQSTSDDRLKKDKVEITNALDKVNSLSSFTHKWNDIAVRAGLEEDKEEIGLSAQEVQGLYPCLVDVNNVMKDPEDPDTDYLTVHYAKVVPLLVASIKELTAKNKALEERLDALEGS